MLSAAGRCDHTSNGSCSELSLPMQRSLRSLPAENDRSAVNNGSDRARDSLVSCPVLARSTSNATAGSSVYSES